MTELEFWTSMIASQNAQEEKLTVIMFMVIFVSVISVVKLFLKESEIK